MTNDCKTCPVSTGTHKPAEAVHQIAEPAATPWKDHRTAALVNDLRDCAKTYGNTQQLRERIANIVAPLCDQLKAAELAAVQQGVQPALYTVIGESGCALPQYSANTEQGVIHNVLAVARNEGYKGDGITRLMELSWKVRPVYTHPTQQGLTDLRWQIVHDHVSGEYIAGRACFVVQIPPLPGASIMRGSVAEHFTKAVDAIAAQAKQGGV